MRISSVMFVSLIVGEVMKIALTWKIVCLSHPQSYASTSNKQQWNDKRISKWMSGCRRMLPAKAKLPWRSVYRGLSFRKTILISSAASIASHSCRTLHTEITHHYPTSPCTSRLSPSNKPVRRLKHQLITLAFLRHWPRDGDPEPQQ